MLKLTPKDASEIYYALKARACALKLDGHDGEVSQGINEQIEHIEKIIRKIGVDGEHLAQKTKPIKAYVMVRGGCVQSAWATSKQVCRLELLDMDNGECDAETYQENERILKHIEYGMKAKTIFGIF